MIKQINAGFISAENNAESMELALNSAERHQIDHLLWSNSGYFPKVEFSIGYTADAVILKYFVKEKYAIARHTQVNDLVYQDSCVEFFLAFNSDNYYNLEFNCIGTPYAAYGKDKRNRTELPVDIVKEMTVLHRVDEAESDGFTRWEMTLRIPFNVFVHDDITSLKGRKCQANFYKCGDETPEPHFLSWNNILNSEPDFHLPQFFGNINFV